MEVSDISTSPRKKLKLHHQTSIDVTIGQSIMPPVEGIAYVANSRSDHNKDDQLSKDVSCGITELVSPQAAGFAGTLKKRCFFFRPQAINMVLIVVSQVYRFSC